MVRIHAIQTGKVGVKEKYMYGERQDIRRLLNTLTDKTWIEPLPIYAWVIEHPEGIIVVDTGESHLASLGGFFAQWHPFTRDARMYVSPEEEIGVQLMQMGISSQDVRQVILTNMHTDHIGGLHHFPHSEILVGRKEYEAAQGLRGRLMGYLPQRFPRWLHPRLVVLCQRLLAHSHPAFP